MTTNYSGIRNINMVSSTLQGSIPGFLAGQDFEKVENARKLSTREYTVHTKLGYISLNSALNADEVLAVAYEYTLNGRTYKVGEFSKLLVLFVTQTSIFVMLTPVLMMGRF